MTEDDWLRLIWRLYLKACACSMDYGSMCQCPISDEISLFLRDQFGQEWHTYMRENYA